MLRSLLRPELATQGNRGSGFQAAKAGVGVLCLAHKRDVKRA